MPAQMLAGVAVLMIILLPDDIGLIFDPGNEVGEDDSGQLEIVNHVRNLTDLIGRVPAEMEGRILYAVNVNDTWFFLSSNPVATVPNAKAMNGALKARLAVGLSKDISQLHLAWFDALPLNDVFSHLGKYVLPSIDQSKIGAPDGEIEQIFGSSWLGHALSVPLPDGRWLNVFLNQQNQIDDTFEDAVGAVVFIVLLFLVVLAFLRRVRKPVRALTAASEQIGRGVMVAPLNETGPESIRSLIRTFNRMNLRLSRYLGDNRQMLAALGHDLRTPITAMRVRAEMIDDCETRDKIILSLEDMQNMTESLLSFVQENAEQEGSRLIDLPTLVESVCNDYSDQGRNVSFTGLDSLAMTCRAASLKRAIDNLIGNAAFYAEWVQVSLGVDGDRAVITIEDDGPGIPDDKISTVFGPFKRLDESRNNRTGGLGLGLPIARTIIRRHGGELVLDNRLGAGLRATITLPV